MSIWKNHNEYPPPAGMMLVIDGGLMMPPEQAAAALKSREADDCRCYGYADPAEYASLISALPWRTNDLREELSRLGDRAMLLLEMPDGNYVAARVWDDAKELIQCCRGDGTERRWITGDWTITTHQDWWDVPDTMPVRWAQVTDGTAQPLSDDQRDVLKGWNYYSEY